MNRKILGTLHGAAARAMLATARIRAQRVTGCCVQSLQQAAGYLAGFAQGLLRAPNA